MSYRIFALINHFQTIVAFHVETSHLICYTNQVTGVCMKCNTGLKWVNGFKNFAAFSVEHWKPWK